MKIYVDVTDNNWFSYLKEQQPDEVNFWQPNSTHSFLTLTESRETTDHPAR